MAHTPNDIGTPNLGTPNLIDGAREPRESSGAYKLQNTTFDTRRPYDGKGPYTAPNGDHYPAKSYKNVLISVTTFILIMECTERLCYYGIVGSLKAYLTNFLGYENSQASALTNTVSTVVYFTPLLGAYMADSIWGRYRTILYFGFLYVIGVIVISIGTYPAIESSAAFLIGLYVLVALGAGGIKPNVVTFGADQFDLHTDEGVKQQQQFFNFFYWVINVGAIFSYSVLAQMATNGMGAISAEYGFFASFTISAAAWIIAIVVFILGSKRYIKLSPSGSALTDFLKIFSTVCTKSWKGLLVFISMVGIVLGVVLSCVAAFLPAGAPRDNVTYLTAAIFIAGWFCIVLLNRDPSYVVEGGKKMAASGSKPTFSEQHIREAYIFLRVWSPVFFAIVFWVVYNQMSSNMYSIACQCNLMVGSSQLNGSLLNLGDTFAIVIFIPIMERFVYPMVEKVKGSKFTSLQKMFWGMICALLAMISTAAIEIARKAAPIRTDLPESLCAAPGVLMSDFSVWWMLIPYMLIGLAEVLISVPLYDLNYVEVPAGVRSTAQALNLFTTSISGGVSSVISLVFASWVTNDLNDGKMENMFWFLSGMTGASCLFFVYVVKDFKYIEELEDSTEFGRDSVALTRDEKVSVSRKSFVSGGRVI